MSKKLRELQGKKAEHVTGMRALNDKAAAEGRELTAEEQAAYDAHKASINDLHKAMERENELIALEASTPAAATRPQPNAPPAAASAGTGIVLRAGAHIENLGENWMNDPRGGFESFGAFAQAVVRAGLPSGGASMDDRLRAAAPTTVSNEASGADGGFVVPPQYSNDVFRLSLGEDAYLPLTDNTEIDSNSMVFPKTEQTPWGSTGVRAYWQVEAGAGTQSKLVLGTQALRLHKLMALVPLTDELVADTNALNSLVPNLIGDSIRWKTNEAILFGNANGQPLGALTSSGPAIVQSKDSGQATNTLSTLNLFNMISRLPPGSYGRAMWLLHPTVIPSLATLVLGNIPLFIPSAPTDKGALSYSPNFGNILGRPAVISHHCSVFSSAGDVQLHDFNYYRTITKPGGVQMAQSLHLYFDADALALRATYRIDGSPKIAAPINPAKGSTTLSPFLQLGAR